MKLATLLAFPLCLIGLQDTPAPHELPQAEPPAQIDVGRLALAVLANEKYIRVFIGDCPAPLEHYPRARDIRYNFQACMFGPAILQRISNHSRNVCWRGDFDHDRTVDLLDWHNGMVSGWYVTFTYLPNGLAATKYWLTGFQDEWLTRFEDQDDGTSASVWDGRSR